MKRHGNIGKVRSNETKEKIRKYRLGKKWSNDIKKKIGKSNLGKKWSEEAKKKVKGRIQYKMTENIKKKISKKLTGKPQPWNQGSNHCLWKGGVTPLYKKIRKSREYKLWRTAIFERDNYTCIWCEEKGGKLNADHIKPFSLYPELRFAIDNGRTLCIECHKKTDTWGFRLKKGY